MMVVFAGKGIEDAGQDAGHVEDSAHIEGIVCGTMNAV
jgi:hypothetical protein